MGKFRGVFLQRGKKVFYWALAELDKPKKMKAIKKKLTNNRK